MEHFDNIRTMLKKEGMDAVALTEEANRFYAAGFPSAGSDGLAVVTAEAAYYFTDARYIEAAQKAVQGAHVALMGRGRGYLQLLQEVIDRHGVKRMGFDDGAMTVADYERYRQGLSCTLCPASRQLTQLRQVKDPEEIAAIEAAQRITEQAYAAIVEEIRPGVSEREIAARLASGTPVGEITDVRGTCAAVPPPGACAYPFVEVPSFEEVSASKEAYARANMVEYDEHDPFVGKAILQKHGHPFLLVNPPAYPLPTEELDAEISEEKPGGLYGELTATFLDRDGETERKMKVNPERRAADRAEGAPSAEEPTKRLNIDLEHLQFGQDYEIK